MPVPPRCCGALACHVLVTASLLLAVVTEGQTCCPAQKLDPKVMESIFASAQRYQEDLGDDNLTTEHLVLAMAQDQRFGEILSVAEGLDSDGVKKAIKKSRVLYNRWVGGRSRARSSADV